jgi:hypothetical protein
MEIKNIQRECVKRVPKKCPFCDIEGMTWSEFQVHASDVYYFDRELGNRVIDEKISVFCTRCDEEIRAEDVRP